MRRAAGVTALVAALALPTCSDPEPPAPGSPAAPAATAAPHVDVDVDVAAFDVQTVGVDAEQFESARPKITELLERYVATAMVEPLRTAQPAGDLSGLFSAVAVDRLKGPERAALVDEGLPLAGDVEVEDARAGVALLANGPGSGVAVASLGVKMTARVGSVPLTIQRSAVFTLSAEGADWKIRGFEVAVTRDTPAGTTTTAAAS